MPAPEHLPFAPRTPIPGQPAGSGLRIVGFSGSTRRPSRTRTLVETMAREFTARRPAQVDIFDLVDAGPGIGAFSRDALPEEARVILDAIAQADALIVGSPVYKGSYSGLFKHVFDFVEPEALAGKPVVIAATGGGHRHALVVEHQLRPLFGFFGAQTAPTAVYAADAEFRDGALADAGVLDRVARAAAELDRLAPRPAAVWSLAAIG